METPRLKKIGVSLLLVVLGGLVFYATFINGVCRPLLVRLQSEAVTGTVRSSTVEGPDPNANPRTDPGYLPIVTYQYSYEGQTYVNDNLIRNPKVSVGIEEEQSSTVSMLLYYVSRLS